MLTENAAAAAVEFGFVGLLLALLILEIMQAAIYFYTVAALTHATKMAARQILTGGVFNQGLTADQFRTQILCPSLPAGLGCANVITNVQTVSEDVYPNGFYAFVKADQSGILLPTMDNSKTSFCIGAAGSYVYLQVYYAMPVFSPTWKALASTSWNNNPVKFVGASTAFETEPFQATAQASGC